ncbi:very long chain fatty acid elongase 6-like [Liolophura sinensis]|uniref:very long chain fatty acid elongase 6-like n=1 Tax=Liolophura sinensis TaxID=3198878 RepID=UPI0031587212
MEQSLSVNITNVSYSVVFNFEKQFSVKSFNEYVQEKWTNSFVYSVLYLIVIFGGRHSMSARPRYELRPALAIWSGTLALFSIAGTVRTLPEAIAAIRNHSLQYSVCVPGFFFHDVTKFWASAFTLSKVIELGDTIFIVLRKQQLIFLHWYHHITVLIYSWYSYKDYIAPGRWFMVMNFVIHSFMYSYYTLRALKFNVPSYVNIFITAMQLTQMVCGCAINVWIFQIKGRGETCHQTYNNIYLSLLMYFSYFVLFAHFFYSTYVLKKGRGKVKKSM